jgi:hypothetical protein
MSVLRSKGLSGEMLRKALHFLEKKRKMVVQSEIWLDILPVIDFSRLESLCLTCDHPIQTEQDIGQIYASYSESGNTLRYPVCFLCRDCYEKHKADILKPLYDFWDEAEATGKEPDQRRVACVEAGQHMELVRYRAGGAHGAFYPLKEWETQSVPPIINMEFPDNAVVTYSRL